MNFARLLELVGEEPVFDTALLMAGDVDLEALRLQLSRWAKAGRIQQVRRSLYTLLSPFQKIRPHPFVIANRLLRPSYVSCQSALAYYGLIPEYVPVTTSITTSRTARWNTSPRKLYISPH
jgi:predicted transcriptional regulator of viral defense system